MGRFFRFFDGWFGRAASLYGLWPLLPSGLVTVITYTISSTTEYIARLGPFGWWAISIFIGISTYLSIVICGWAVEITRERRTRREINAKIALASAINPLEKRFLRKRLLLQDFADPFGHSLKEKVFEECELIGPSTIVILCEYARNTHYNVEFAKINDDKIFEIPNKIILSGGAIRDCKVANVLFLVPMAMVPTFEQGFSGQIQWLN